MRFDIDRFEEILKQAWSKESSYRHVFEAGNPALGQCAVTALVVQDYFGGKIVWCVAIQPDGTEVSHYFNKIEGKEIDLTRSQFPAGSVIPSGGEKKKGFATTRDYVLSDADTRARYSVLSGRIESLLKKEGTE